MSERYFNGACQDCGASAFGYDQHDAFHDRIDKIETRLEMTRELERRHAGRIELMAAVLLQRDREEMERSGNPDTPPSAENPDKPEHVDTCRVYNCEGCVEIDESDDLAAYLLGKRDGYAAALSDAVDAVKALPWTPTFTDLWVIDKADAVAAIEALRGDR